MSAVFERFAVDQCKFGVKLAAADRAQVPHGDDSYETDSRSPLKQDSMQGWKQQNEWQQPQSERGHDWRKKRNRPLGFPLALDAREPTAVLS